MSFQCFFIKERLSADVAKMTFVSHVDLYVDSHVLSQNDFSAMSARPEFRLRPILFDDGIRIIANQILFSGSVFSSGFQFEQTFPTFSINKSVFVFNFKILSFDYFNLWSFFLK